MSNKHVYRYLCSKQMEKSYATLVSRRHGTMAPDAVTTAVKNLRRHSYSLRDGMCSRCGNDEMSFFQVTDADHVTGSVTEVKCKRCNETSYVCQCHCYCLKSPTPNGLEKSHKQQLRRRTLGLHHSRRSIHICNVIDSTVILLLRNNSDGNSLCSCGNSDQDQLEVKSVDRLGFITSVQCTKCQKQLALSAFEESYVAQTLYHAQSDQTDVIQKAFDGDYVAHVHEVCNLLRRHSFYNLICPEFDSDDQERCRITAINEESGKVIEVEFDLKEEGRSHKVQRLQITCRSGCYYHHNNLPSKYESTYKEEIRKHLDGSRREQTQQTDEIQSEEAILSCTVLAANASILRRHNIDNKLCQKCKNDDHNFLEVIETDSYGFITRVQCIKCKQSTSTECHNSRFYYEEIDESVRLNRGDHISWHRGLAFWHHAIVTRPNDQTISVAHYGSTGCSVTFHESKKDRQDMSTSCFSGTAYRITYDDCYTNEYTALRAEKLVGKKQYNVLNRNCEHSSHWCKTGLTRSDQVMNCFSSVGKSVLAFFLRILNMALLLIFQVIHEKREGIQIDRKAFERFEHIVTSSYMLLVFLLFLAWSMYTECNKLKRTSANKCCCARPLGVACGVTIRIIVRELIATLGPFLLIWFEDNILDQQEALWIKQVTISVILIVVTGASYLLGAVIGTLLEYLCKCCISCVATPSTQREHISDHTEAEIPENDELSSISTTRT